MVKEAYLSEKKKAVKKILLHSAVVLMVCSLNLFAQNQKSIAVLNLKSGQIKEADCVAFTNLLTTELQNAGNYRVLAWDDVTKMLEHQAGKQALGCDDDACIAEIGGALGVDYILAGDLGGIGDRYFMTIKLIDIVKAQTTSRVSRKVKGNMGLLVDEMAGAVAELLGAPVSAGTGGSSSGTSAVVQKEGMAWIPGGTFMMGSSDGEDDEKPVHRVTVSGFYIDKTEVTQQEYERVMGNNPSRFKGCPTCPVEQVSWHDAKAYCEKVGKRLPTEAEWEYAARAGSSTKYYWGDKMNGDYAWYDGNWGSKTHPVGQKKPNAWGLYDMSGNVWEWCSDWYDSNYYRNSPSKDPQGPSSGSYRVVRGGSWGLPPRSARVAGRFRYTPDSRNNYFGFRCVLCEGR